MPIQGSDGLIDMGVCRPSNYYHRRARGEVSVADGLVVKAVPVVRHGI